MNAAANLSPFRQKWPCQFTCRAMDDIETGDLSPNGRMRDELLNETMLRTMAHARAVIRSWATEYNEERPHSALGYQTPKAFAEHLFTATGSNAAPDESSVAGQRRKSACCYVLQNR